MNTLNDYFKPEALFSRDNPLLKSAENMRQMLFDTFDRTARVQLAFTEDLLDLNRERYESLYRQQSFSDLVAAQQDLVAELGKRTAQYASELKEVVTTMQAEAGEAANDLAGEAEPKTTRPRSKKTA